MSTPTANEFREMDAWIAERLFNWKPTYAAMKGDLYYRHGGHGYTSSIYEAGCYSKEDAEKELVRGEPMQIVPHERPNYSADPASVMKVLEKCAEKAEVAVRHSSGIWYVGSIDWEGEQVHQQCSATTLPLAICLFSKKLYGT